MSDSVFQQCISATCGATYPVEEALVKCGRCGSLLDISYDWEQLPVPGSLKDFQAKWSQRNNPLSFSGIWRFHDLLPFAPRDKVVTIGEGQTLL